MGQPQRAVLAFALLCAQRFGDCGHGAGAESLEPLTKDRGEELLRAAGVVEAWPAFEGHLELLATAFADQATLPTPIGGISSPGRAAVISEQPLVKVIDDFLSDDECDFLRVLSEHGLAGARVVESAESMLNMVEEVRNNEQYWIRPDIQHSIPLVRHMLKRMHRVARVPDECAEALQIGRYNQSRKYEAHMDSDPANGVARPMTLLIYLNDVEAGGDTLFPGSRAEDCTREWHTHPSTGERIYGSAMCCGTPDQDAPDTVRVSPKKGRAVLFMNHLPHGEMEKYSLHIGCPVVAGEKWVAQRWMRMEPHDRVRYDVGPGRDQRWDGPPASRDEVEASDEPRCRAVSGVGPRLYLEERALSDQNSSAAATAAAEVLGALDLAAVTTPDGVVEVSLSPDDLDMAAPALQYLAARAHDLANLPSGGRPRLVLRRTGVGAFEAVHLDSLASAGQPVPVTVAFVLAGAEEGGDLLFPSGSQECKADPVGCCAHDGPQTLRVPLRRRDALILYSHQIGGPVDEMSEHGTCPVRRGESLVAEVQFMFAPSITQPFIEFESKLDTTAHVFWAPPEGGDDTYMGSISPGEKRQLTSFAGHVFSVRDEAGEFISSYTVKPQTHMPQLFVISQHKQEL